MPESDEFDLMLRSALDTYADPGPESGIEARVLARVSAEAVAAPRRRWLPWVVALPVAAGLLLLFVLFEFRPAHRPSDDSGLAHPSHQPLINTARPELSTALRPDPVLRGNGPHARPRPRMETVAAEAAPLPKLDVFPTPQPLTPEEQAFVVFAARAPQSERQALIEAHKQAEAPLSIAAIQIQPLDPPDQGGN